MVKNKLLCVVFVKAIARINKRYKNIAVGSENPFNFG